MKIITPLVTMLSSYDGKRLERIYKAYRRCYTSGMDVPGAESEDVMYTFVAKMLMAEHPHESPLEHESFTFHIVCSRSCSHQFVRHRIASYSQQSQRYVAANELEVILPDAIMNDQALRYGVTMHLNEAEGMYKSMLASGFAAEDARAVLPNCTATAMVVTMNCRELLHFFSERCCERAQEEIRSIAEGMLTLCQMHLPAVFIHAGPHCYKLKHCPEAKPCGMQPWKGHALHE